MIVVTGGTGTVGSRLVGLLVQEGEHVRAFCRDGDKVRRKFGSSCSPRLPPSRTRSSSTSAT